MKLPALLLAALAAQAQPGPGESRVQTVEWHADQVVPLQVAAGYQLMVEFAADERIESVAVGDSGAWQVTPNRSGDRVFVKPLQGNLSTNLTVVTSARTYTFELSPLYGPSADMPYVVRFTYPAADATAEAEPAGAMAGRYRLSGARALRPSRISDDGIHTYIEWPREAALPAVYALDERGRESLVNGMMRDDLFVIDAVVPRLVFRIDRDVARAERVAERAHP
ncbi:MAG TPA: TrbG/VirB9 family P-type conjugative transfer protein [Allosphingosinicella sp.]|nr:TrbG/VirB9 family P-type conjugative transfer protein [Allosphingosinicella sp.]